MYSEDSRWLQGEQGKVRGQSELRPHQEHVNTLARGVNNNQREPCVNAAVLLSVCVRVCVSVHAFTPFCAATF